VGCLTTWYKKSTYEHRSARAVCGSYDWGGGPAGMGVESSVMQTNASYICVHICRYMFLQLYIHVYVCTCVLTLTE
jgi:hypothetical protein